jgi:hypothetical protein
MLNNRSGLLVAVDQAAGGRDIGTVVRCSPEWTSRPQASGQQKGISAGAQRAANLFKLAVRFIGAAQAQSAWLASFIGCKSSTMARARDTSTWV